jgi:hypothetical protein
MKNKMRDINRISPIMEKLEKLWMENPDFRLGQLFMTIIKPEVPNSKIFYIEDDEILRKIEEKITEIRK